MNLNCYSIVSILSKWEYVNDIKTILNFMMPTGCHIVEIGNLKQIRE